MMRGRAWIGAVLALVAVAACGERRDIADVAAGLEPFTELRGFNIVELRSGVVRALRRDIARAPLEGYRERIGAWDVVYAVPGFDGTGDESWPREDVQILDIEATQEFASDSLAAAAWTAALGRVRAETGATPHCLAVQGPGFALRVVEFDRGGDWRLALSMAPAVRLRNRTTLSARHAVAVRRSSLTQRFPEQGQPNPDSLPTWTREECPTP